MVLTLGMEYWAVSLMVALFLLVCVVLILTVLIQRPQGGGLSGAFGAGGGGGGSGQTAFGARTGDALTMATIAMFIIYLGVAVVLNFAARPSDAPAPPPALTAPAGQTAAGDAPDDATGTTTGEGAEPTGDDASGEDDAAGDGGETDGPTDPGSEDAPEGDPAPDDGETP